MRLLPDSLYFMPVVVLFLIVLAGTAAAALLIQLPFRLQRVRAASTEMAKITNAVATISGALFGLSITFLANSVWSMEDKARETVNAEARAIRVIDVYMDSLTGPTRDGLARLLADYGHEVAAEWDGMSQASDSPAAEQALRDLYAAIVKGFGEGEQNQMLQQRLLGALDNVSIAREQRFSIAQDYVTLNQWTLVVGLGLVLLFVVTASHAAFPLARRISVSALTVAISIMLFVIIARDRPFVGQGALTPEPIMRAAGAVP